MQIGLSLKFLVLLVLACLFTGFEVYLSIWPVITAVVQKDLVDFVTFQILIRTFCFVIPLIFVIGAFSLVFSHYIAGPVYRLEQTIDDLVSGKDVRLIRLRKGDELNELVEKVNALIRTMGREKKAT
jgi:signal transduction histidine kinase